MAGTTTKRFVAGRPSSEARGETEEGTNVADVVWVWRLRGDSVASVEAFPIPPQTGGRVS